MTSKRVTLKAIQESLKAQGLEEFGGILTEFITALGMVTNGQAAQIGVNSATTTFSIYAVDKHVPVRIDCKPRKDTKRK